jgi:hypothetical protein
MTFTRETSPFDLSSAQNQKLNEVALEVNASAEGLKAPFTALDALQLLVKESENLLLFGAESLEEEREAFFSWAFESGEVARWATEKLAEAN